MARSILFVGLFVSSSEISDAFVLADGLFIVRSYVRELEEKRFAKYKYVTVEP